MAPLRYGPANLHVQASNGPDANIMKFYITEYSSHYGQDGFLPKLGRHTGTGYQSNFRPGMYYSRRLDDMDNPTLGRDIATNYQSVTTQHYKPSRGSDGKDFFPASTHLVKSGFVRDTPKTIPTSHQGPKSFSTETQARYNGQSRPYSADLTSKKIGRKEGSGFTHAHNIEPITFLPSQPYDRNKHWHIPVNDSVMKTDFSHRGCSPRIVDPRTARPIASNAERNTGYTRETAPGSCYTSRENEVYTSARDVHPTVMKHLKKHDPAEYTNVVYPFPNISMTTAAFQGQQTSDDNLRDKIGNVTIGNKEETGYTENNSEFIESVETPATLKRFGTEYWTRYTNKNPEAENRMGHTAGGIMRQMANGFTKGTARHDKSLLYPHRQLHGLHPYVTRSIIARDPLANQEGQAMA